jgi:hypothetical protein
MDQNQGLKDVYAQQIEHQRYWVLAGLLFFLHLHGSVRHYFQKALQKQFYFFQTNSHFQLYE